MRRITWPAAGLLAAVPALLYVTANAQTTRQLKNAGVNSIACAACHPAQAETYRLTGMGRSFTRLNASNRIENFSCGSPFYHELSPPYYNVKVRDRRYYLSQYQIGFDGTPTNLVEKPVDYAVGSGNHARTYLSRTSRNTLIELPLAWYAEKVATGR
jgi:hypothetical protein